MRLQTASLLWRVVRLSSAEARPLVFCDGCGVTHSAQFADEVFCVTGFVGSERGRFGRSARGSIM
jgi:hypothetical protein